MPLWLQTLLFAGGTLLIIIGLSYALEDVLGLRGMRRRAPECNCGIEEFGARVWPPHVKHCPVHDREEAEDSHRPD